MSCLRTRVRTLLALPVVAALLITWIETTTKGHWDGQAAVRLDFLVLDDVTGDPIPGASVRLDSPRSSFEARTATDGRASFDLIAPAGGRLTFFRRERHVHYREWQLSVDADGYAGARPDLGDLTSDSRYHARNTVPPITIRLGKRPAKS